MSDEQRQKETERLLEALPAPSARPEFRSGLRQRFLARAASAPPVDVMGDEPVRAPRSGAARHWKAWAVLAAAAGIALLLWVTKPAPRHWQLLPGSTATHVRVDGERLPVAEGDLLVRALNDARSVAAEGGRLRLSFRDQYAFELPEGARVEFAAFGNTGGVDPFSLSVQGSALRVVTGPGFHGHELHLKSGAASLKLTGTALAIDTLPEGVCVCGLEGRIAVLQKGSQDRYLEPGKQCWFPKDGGEPGWGEAQDAHVAPVRELEAAVSGHWRP
jgi:ferric-dicitrate binding protein FerR (iron transport regulator)